MKTIGFIGGGNMAESLLGGLLASGREASSLLIAEPLAERREHLATRHGVECSADNLSVAQRADVLVFAVKPQVLREVAETLVEPVQLQKPLVVSIAAGIRSSDLERWLGGNLPVVRAMPNTPALVQAGASGLYANHHVTVQQRDIAESILRAVGLTVWLENENQLDIVTALSGSGPGYIFRVIEAMEKAAVEAGLAPQVSRLLTIETVLGAARLAMEADDSPAELRRKVTSPGGTTEQGLLQLEQADIDGMFRKAIDAAAARSREMADQLGEQS